MSSYFFTKREGEPEGEKFYQRASLGSVGWLTGWLSGCLAGLWAGWLAAWLDVMLFKTENRKGKSFGPGATIKLGTPHRKGKSFEGVLEHWKEKVSENPRKDLGTPKAQIDVAGPDGTGREKVVRGGFDFTRADFTMVILWHHGHHETMWWPKNSTTNFSAPILLAGTINRTLPYIYIYIYIEREIFVLFKK